MSSRCPSARREKCWAPSLDGREKSRLVLSPGLSIGAVGVEPGVIPKANETGEITLVCFIEERQENETFSTRRQGFEIPESLWWSRAYSPGRLGRQLHQFRRGQCSHTRRHARCDSVLPALLVVCTPLARFCHSGRTVHGQQRQEQ